MFDIPELFSRTAFFKAFCPSLFGLTQDNRSSCKLHQGSFFWFLTGYHFDAIWFGWTSPILPIYLFESSFTIESVNILINISKLLFVYADTKYMVYKVCFSRLFLHRVISSNIINFCKEKYMLFDNMSQKMEYTSRNLGASTFSTKVVYKIFFHRHKPSFYIIKYCK